MHFMYYLVRKLLAALAQFCLPQMRLVNGVEKKIAPKIAVKIGWVNKVNLSKPAEIVSRPFKSNKDVSTVILCVYRYFVSTVILSKT
jgi:hypothetical protein